MEQSDLEEVGERGLVVQGEVEPHRALARIRTLRFQKGRENKLPYPYVECERRFGFSFGGCETSIGDQEFVKCQVRSTALRTHVSCE